MIKILEKLLSKINKKPELDKNKIIEMNRLLIKNLEKENKEIVNLKNNQEVFTFDEVFLEAKSLESNNKITSSVNLVVFYLDYAFHLKGPKWVDQELKKIESYDLSIQLLMSVLCSTGTIKSRSSSRKHIVQLTKDKAYKNNRQDLIDWIQ